ncbi:hypothetical protein G6F37_012023 [Rhizopus arrhizus]|nr:hypothetical protein G6F38_012056 [Rhizopus arrhizus]KAG1146145.1 hypothetical protein G6F37_012023 [Rhizopus arrhizus]
MQVEIIKRTLKLDYYKNSKVKKYCPQYVESVVILANHWFLITSFSSFIHNNPKVDDCADKSIISYQSNPIAFIRRKFQYGKDYFELTIRFGYVELVVTSGFFISVDGKFYTAFLGSSIHNLPELITTNFNTTSTSMIFVSIQQKHYILRKRIMNQYLKFHSVICLQEHVLASHAYSSVRFVRFVPSYANTFHVIRQPKRAFSGVFLFVSLSLFLCLTVYHFIFLATIVMPRLVHLKFACFICKELKTEARNLRSHLLTNHLIDVPARNRCFKRSDTNEYIYIKKLGVKQHVDLLENYECPSCLLHCEELEDLKKHMSDIHLRLEASIRKQNITNLLGDETDNLMNPEKRQYARKGSVSISKHSNTILTFIKPTRQYNDVPKMPEKAITSLEDIVTIMAP